MARDAMKLRRVSPGLYTTGSVTVMHHPWNFASKEALRAARAEPWLATWLDWMSTKHERRFPTLAAVRAWLAEGGRA